MDDYIKRLNSLDSLSDFYELARDVEKYLFDYLRRKISAKSVAMSHYELWIVEAIDGREIIVRPFNSTLFIAGEELKASWGKLQKILPKLSNQTTLTDDEKDYLDEHGLDKTLYSVFQLIGCGVDVFVSSSNQARKIFGMKFEELIQYVLNDMGLVTSSTTYTRSFKTSSGSSMVYTYLIDLVISDKKIQTSGDHINPSEIIGSIKTSSKDRMQKIFVDKTLLERVSGIEGIKYVAIFHNDVQRSGKDNVSGTFVAKLFLTYGELLTRVDGVYYLDPPSHIDKRAYTGKLKWFTDFVRHDIWKLLV